MDMFLEFVLVYVIYFAILGLSYYFTEVKRLPNWLQFPPFHCRKCLCFWSLIAVYITIGLSFNMYAFIVAGVLMAILTAISMHIGQKNKTVKIEDFDKFDEYNNCETADCDEILVDEDGFKLVKK